LEDVTKALKTAGNTKKMLEELRTAAQIKSIQERLNEKEKCSAECGGISKNAQPVRYEQ
jgi:hypothetical protein